MTIDWTFAHILIVILAIMGAYFLIYFLVHLMIAAKKMKQDQDKTYEDKFKNISKN